MATNYSLTAAIDGVLGSEKSSSQQSVSIMQRFIAGLVIFGVAQVFVFVSAYCYWVMLAEVNRKLPDDAQISYFWGNFVKSERIEAEYRRLYPSGRLIRYSRAAFAVGAILGLLSAFVAGFFDAFLVGPK